MGEQEKGGKEGAPTMETSFLFTMNVRTRPLHSVMFFLATGTFSAEMKAARLATSLEQPVIFSGCSKLDTELPSRSMT